MKPIIERVVRGIVSEMLADAITVEVRSEALGLTADREQFG